MLNPRFRTIGIARVFNPGSGITAGSKVTLTGNATCGAGPSVVGWGPVRRHDRLAASQPVRHNGQLRLASILGG
jgi:hypothetical protein